MYRRDISSTLRILAVLLGAFVFYHVWTQPPATPVPASTSLPSTNIDAMTSFPPVLVEPTPPLDIPRTRLIEFGEAPSAAHQQIRDDLDRGEYKLAESALRTLSDTSQTSTRNKAYVAALWNNLGVQQEKLGGVEVSVKAFKRAVAFAPHNATALLNLTQAYWGLRHRALTQQFLETVIQTAPDDPFPHLALAELLIDKGRNADASPHLKRAKTRIHRDPHLTTLLEKLEEKTAQVSAVKRITPKPKLTKQPLAPERTSPQAEAADLTPKENVAPAPAAEATAPASPANAPVHTAPAPAETAP